MSQLEDDASLERHMELTQLKAGQVLSTDNVVAIEELFNDFEEEMEFSATAYMQGVEQGRLEAGGAQVTDLLQQIENLRLELTTEKMLNRVYRKLDENRVG